MIHGCLLAPFAPSVSRVGILAGTGDAQSSKSDTGNRVPFSSAHLTLIDTDFEASSTFRCRLVCVEHGEAATLAIGQSYGVIAREQHAI